MNKLFLLGVRHFLFNRLRESSPSSFLSLKPIFYWYSGKGLPKLTNKKGKQFFYWKFLIDFDFWISDQKSIKPNFIPIQGKPIILSWYFKILETALEFLERLEAGEVVFIALLLAGLQLRDEAAVLLHGLHDALLRLHRQVVEVRLVIGGHLLDKSYDVTRAVATSEESGSILELQLEIWRHDSFSFNGHVDYGLRAKPSKANFKYQTTLPMWSLDILLELRDFPRLVD